MTEAPDILVLGATGATGRATAEALAARGVAYRALSRDPSRVRSRLAVPVAGDLDDAEGLRAALAGARAAYVVTPSSERAETQQIRFLELAAEAGVTRVVLLSQLGARADSPVRFLRYHAAVDAHAASLGLGVTALRPNLFMQGLLAFAEVIRAGAVLPAPIGDAPVSLVDVRDIGEVAAHALTADEPLGVQTLTGPEALTHAQLADELARATGRAIRFEQVAPERFAEMLSGVLPPWQAEGMLEDYAHYARGEAAEVSPAVRTLIGREARGFRAFAEENAAAFAPAH
ncbi:MAG: NmrA family NAD(P)-binding protein [Microbacterium sp.]